MSAIEKTIPLIRKEQTGDTVELENVDYFFDLEYGKIVIEPKSFTTQGSDSLSNHLKTNIIFLPNMTKINELYDDEAKIFFIQIAQCKVNDKNFFIRPQLKTPNYIAKAKLFNEWVGVSILDNRKEALFDYVDFESGWSVDIIDDEIFPNYNAGFDKNLHSKFIDKLPFKLEMEDAPSFNRYRNLILHKDEKNIEMKNTFLEIISKHKNDKNSLTTSKAKKGLSNSDFDKLTDVTNWSMLDEDECFEMKFQTFVILANEKSEMFCLGGIEWDFETYGFEYPQYMGVKMLPEYTKEFVTCMCNWNKYAYQQGFTPLYFKNIKDLQYKENTSTSNSSSFDQTLDKAIKSKRTPNADEYNV